MDAERPGSTRRRARSSGRRRPGTPDRPGRRTAVSEDPEVVAKPATLHVAADLTFVASKKTSIGNPQRVARRSNLGVASAFTRRGSVRTNDGTGTSPASRGVIHDLLLVTATMPDEVTSWNTTS